MAEEGLSLAEYIALRGLLVTAVGEGWGGERIRAELVRAFGEYRVYHDPAVMGYVRGWFDGLLSEASWSRQELEILRDVLGQFLMNAHRPDGWSDELVDESLAEVATDHGVSVEQVREILHRSGSDSG